MPRKMLGFAEDAVVNSLDSLKVHLAENSMVGVIRRLAEFYESNHHHPAMVGSLNTSKNTRTIVLKYIREKRASQLRNLQR